MHFPDHLASRLSRFQIETPSWGYADTGTRFGKFLQPAAATTIEEKLADAAQVHKLTGAAPTIALHTLWDFPQNKTPEQIAQLAKHHNLQIGSINPNLFQDQLYKLGSVTNRDPAIRAHALQHLLDSVNLLKQTNSQILSLWFADGTNYPGQGHIRQRKLWMQEALQKTHTALAQAAPSATMLIEYKPFEPAFYHTDIADWGMAAAFARAAGPQAKVLVDTGHHLPGTNIEHIVAHLIDENLLGGFHFNDRKYADDDLTMGSIDPYQLFRIFHEITQAEFERGESGGNGSGPTRAIEVGSSDFDAPPTPDLPIAYMIDQSHNLKPKTEAMIESITTAQELFTKALLVDHAAAHQARENDDIVLAERTLKHAFNTDVRPFLADYRKSKGLPPDPLLAHRESNYNKKAAADRGPRKPKGSGSYA